MTDVPAFTLRQHGLQALYRFETQFPLETSFPNFLWELRELSSLIPRVLAFYNRFVEALAGGYLQWEFGWKPFLQDLAKLGAITDLVAARLEWLKRTYGKVTRLGYQAEDVFLPSILDPHRFPTISWRGLQTETVAVNVSSTLRVGALLYHELPHLDDYIGTLRGFIGALGLNNPLLVVWQALPYSFVVDWFLNVGGTLEALAGFQDKTVEWNVYNVNWSMKTKARFDVFQVNHPASYPPFSEPRKFGHIDVVSYRRFLGYPEASWISANASLTPKQATLLSAMILG
jgi:hypothetical protein